VTAPRVAIFGGTFDPFHLGHLAAAEQAREALVAEAAWLVPAGAPSLRPPTLASAEDRMAICQAVIGGALGFEVMDIELRRPGPSYTVETMRGLAAAHPDRELWLVLGADAVRRLPDWHESEALVAENRICVVNRDGQQRVSWAEAVSLGLPPDRTRLVGIESPPISASEIRHRIAAGAPIDDLVGPAAARLIAERGLYRDGAASVR